MLAARALVWCAIRLARWAVALSGVEPRRNESELFENSQYGRPEKV